MSPNYLFGCDLENGYVELPHPISKELIRFDNMELRDSSKICNAFEMSKNVDGFGSTKDKETLSKLFLEAWSPFLELEIFRKDFWKRFANCILHLCLEGNWKRHLTYLATKYKHDKIAIGKFILKYWLLSDYFF